jgi:hypothetical protein
MRDKLLIYSTVISILVNILFVILVGNSDIFQVQAIKNELHAQHIKLVRPPIKRPPPPKRKPPPPPKQQVKQLPPPPTPQPVVQRQIVQPIHQAAPVQVPISSPKGNEVAGPTTQTPPPAVVAPPAPTPPPAPPPVVAPPPPVVVAPPPPVVVAPTKPRKPVHTVPEAIGNWADTIQMPDGVGAGDLSATDIVATFLVDASGHAHFERMKPKSTGNRDIDDAIKNAIESIKFIPATDDDGNPKAAEYSHEFTIG